MSKPADTLNLRLATPEEHEAEGKEKAAAKGEAVRSKPLLAERLPLVEAP